MSHVPTAESAARGSGRLSAQVTSQQKPNGDEREGYRLIWGQTSRQRDCKYEDTRQVCAGVTQAQAGARWAKAR